MQVRAAPPAVREAHAPCWSSREQWGAEEAGGQEAEKHPVLPRQVPPVIPACWRLKQVSQNSKPLEALVFALLFCFVFWLVPAFAELKRSSCLSTK